MFLPYAKRAAASYGIETSIGSGLGIDFDIAGEDSPPFWLLNTAPAPPRTATVAAAAISKFSWLKDEGSTIVGSTRRETSFDLAEYDVGNIINEFTAKVLGLE